MMANAETQFCPGPTPLDEPVFFDAYSGYATSIINGSEKVRLTKEGLRILRGAESLPFYYENWDCLSFKAITTALHRIYRQKNSKHETFETFSEGLAGASRISISSARRHILWLAKYGYVTISSGHLGVET